MSFDRTLAVIFFLSTVSAVTVAVMRNHRTVPVGSLGQECNSDGTCSGASLSQPEPSWSGTRSLRPFVPRRAVKSSQRGAEKLLLHANDRVSHEAAVLCYLREHHGPEVRADGDPFDAAVEVTDALDLYEWDTDGTRTVIPVYVQILTEGFYDGRLV